ncbi:hypothetical protein [Neisseria sicca]|uniref:hypothetical protein n=1 Tax=Neisseria sicca TaxID=490 RepID=UPI0012DF1301|nr:hypothetical protein [Neisseria sicca]
MKKMAASSSKNLPEHSGKLGFGAINSREEAKIFRLRSSENGHNKLRTIPALLSMLIKQADIFRRPFTVGKLQMVQSTKNQTLSAQT